VTLGQTLPVLPVRAVADAVRFYESRLGFTSRFRDADFAIMVRDAAELHLWQSDDDTWRGRAPAVLLGHPALDGDGNLLTFFHRATPRT